MEVSEATIGIWQKSASLELTMNEFLELELRGAAFSVLHPTWQVGSPNGIGINPEQPNLSHLHPLTT